MTFLVTAVEWWSLDRTIDYRLVGLFASATKYRIALGPFQPTIKYIKMNSETGKNLSNLIFFDCIEVRRNSKIVKLIIRLYTVY
jgi:hypothetical protein